MCNVNDKPGDGNTCKSITDDNHHNIIFKTICSNADRSPDSTDYVIQNEFECNLQRVYQRHPTLPDMNERFEEIAILLENFILVDEEQIVPSKGKCFLLGKPLNFDYIHV